MNKLQRQRIVEELKRLIGNFDSLRGASEFLQSEGVEWWEADKTYVDSLKSWITIAESVLASSGRIGYVEDWSKASAFEITVLNVYDYAQKDENTS